MLSYYHSTHRVAVCEVDIEQITHPTAVDLTGFEGYRQAFVVVRYQKHVVGQFMLPVDEEGRIARATIQARLPAVTWHIWQIEMRTNPSATLPPASVVVCTRNRTSDLARCLTHLVQLMEQGHEVLVVDSCPADDSTEQLMAKYPTIRYLRESRPGAGIARNRGLLAATQPIVAFTDDDAVVDARWLAALLRNFEDPMVAVVTGITMPMELETPAQIWFEQTNGFSRGFDRKVYDVNTLSPLAAGLAGASVNVAIRRSALEEIGLFNEALGPGTPARSGEDHEFFYRVLASGYRIIYDPGALVWHKHRRDWPALQRILYDYGVAVFAWWTHALIHQRELTLLYHAPHWFWQHHTRHLLQALLRRPNHIPLDLAWAEFKGALLGPWSYWRSQRWLRRINQAQTT